jgi:hypothetical protein
MVTQVDIDRYNSAVMELYQAKNALWPRIKEVVGHLIEIEKMCSEQYYYHFQYDTPSEPRWCRRFRIEDGIVEVGYEETWAYGGHAGGATRFPISWLFDDSWVEPLKKEYQDKIDAEKETRRAKRLQELKEELSKLES